MPIPEIEQFANLLVREVRDISIESCDTVLSPEANGPAAKRWCEKLDSCSSRELAVSMIPDCVDETIFNLLHAIDEGILRVSFVADNGNIVDLTTDGKGEMAGWYMSRWISEYSKQRLIDDFEDLTDFFKDMA